MDRRAFLATLSATALLPGLARAAKVTYTPGLINARLDAGETLIVDFYAPWCGTCLVQHKVIDRLKAANPAYDAKITFIEVDWDTYRRTDLTSALNVIRRSTLIAIGPDRRELGRVVAGTSKTELKALLDLALTAATA